MAPDPDTLPELDTALRKLARRLVVDAAKADDVVQDAWLVALRRDESTVASWAAWLAGTVRKLTGEARRAQERRTRHEASAAPRDRAPSAAELVERESTRRQLMDALLALPETYRIAVAMRYLEDLPPRRIAAKLGIPTETARTRVKRGIELLRERLDADRGGDRRAWGLALAPLAVPKATALGAALTTAGEVLLMNVATKVGLATVALCGITWIVMALTDVPGVPKKDAQSANSATDEPGATARRLSSTEAVTAARAPADVKLDTNGDAASVPSPTGSLEATVKFESDGAPAVGVGLTVTMPYQGDPNERSWSAITDAGGRARFDDLPAYLDYMLFADRSRRPIMGLVEVRPGETTQVTPVIPVGAQIEGVVLTPERNPVAGAAIFVAKNQVGADGHILAHTAADGTFSIRDAEWTSSIGARAPGYAASPLRYLYANAGARCRFEFVLRARGGSVTGHVVDERQRPIANAVLELTEACILEDDNSVAFDDGDRGFKAIGIRTTTDADGAFLFDGVASGSHGLLVRARGYAVASATLTCAEGARSSKDVCLPSTPIVRGRVVDDGGKPQPSAQVSIGDWRTLDHAFARTTDQGEFRFETLPLGSVNLQVTTNTGARRTQSVTLTAGAETVVEIALPAGLLLRGRVVDDNGAGREGFNVELEASDPKQGEGARNVRTASDGAFEIPDCRDTKYRLTVAAPGVQVGDCVARFVRPSPEEIRVVVPNAALPSAKLIVRVIDDLGQPVGGANVMLDRAQGLGGGVRPTDAKSGICAFDPIPAGTYGIKTLVPGYAWASLASRRVGPNEIVECELRLTRPGTLIAHLVNMTDDEAASIKRLELVSTETRVRGYLERSDEPTVFRGNDLRPGRWTLVARTSSIYVPTVPVEIRSGDETHVELTRADGIPVTIRVSAFEFQTALVIRVVDHDGVIVADQSHWSKTDGTALEVLLTLPPGSYVVSASTDEERAEAPLEIGDEPVTADLDPK